MLQAIAAHPRGAAVGFKASGGIRTVAEAAGYIASVRDILGPAALSAARLRFGASSLLGDIERVLDGDLDPFIRTFLLARRGKGNGKDAGQGVSENK